MCANPTDTNGNARQTAEPKPHPITQAFIGQSEAMQRVFGVMQRVAASDSTVLINGETGTGKGLAARAIHAQSPRRGAAFVAINCGAIPENLLESELFGHVRGAFTGATANKVGKFEQAHGGTIFLDEIGDMSADLQVKILRVLEEGAFEPVGGNRTVNVDVRIIAATHRDLEARVGEGLFREDLYYRLYVIPLVLPPLRARGGDVALLAGHFLEEFNARGSGAITGFSQEAQAALGRYGWPGNIRELRNLIERLVVLKQSGAVELDDLPAKLREHSGLDPVNTGIALSDDGINLNSAVTEFEKALILQSLEKTKWVKNKAAKLLKLNRTTLVEKIKRYQLETQDTPSNCASRSR
ncbi:MAG: sigma-54 dependent transcriptional regulator [Desulfobacterales bacterium]|nr:sigma-54 dependent transcriptional regulator [Desulfobacterales bacterium]MDJ0855501.1 sigma-54 dependent transcriptional regulator [Desulfobacterales bacterium]